MPVSFIPPFYRDVRVEIAPIQAFAISKNLLKLQEVSGGLYMFNSRVFRTSWFMRSAALLVMIALPPLAVGQVSNDFDQGVPMPPSTMTLGIQDSAALQEIEAFRKAVETTPLTGLQGQGTLTPNALDTSGSAISPQTATLWIQGAHKCRLDVQKSKGLSSMRLNEGYGAIQHEDGRTRQITAQNALHGLFAFPVLMQTSFPDANTTLVDQGMVVIDAIPLHRITVGSAWPGSQISHGAQPRTTITDLYFDPRTNLLVKSAFLGTGSRAEPTRYLQVMSYRDYRATSGFDLPYQYSERFNGQLLWTLQINTFQLQSDLDESGFHF
jgi:hypothetical protein